MRNSGFEPYICDFSEKFGEMHELLTLQFAENHVWFIWLSRDSRSLKFLITKFRKILDCRFRIFVFSDLMVISNKISMHNIIKLMQKNCQFSRNSNIFTQENRAFWKVCYILTINREIRRFSTKQYYYYFANKIIVTITKLLTST